jgi:hypothetical protein
VENLRRSQANWLRTSSSLSRAEPLMQSSTAASDKKVGKLEKTWGVKAVCESWKEFHLAAHGFVRVRKARTKGIVFTLLPAKVGKFHILTLCPPRSEVIRAWWKGCFHIKRIFIAHFLC